MMTAPTAIVAVANAFYTAQNGVSVHVRELARGSKGPRARVSYRLNGHDTVAEFTLGDHLVNAHSVRLISFLGEAHPIVMLIGCCGGHDLYLSPTFIRLVSGSLQQIPVRRASHAPAGLKPVFSWDLHLQQTGEHRREQYYASRTSAGPMVLWVETQLH